VYFHQYLKREIHLTAQAAWRSGVGKNAASLYTIQFANYILPLITVPYLVRVLGPEYFGLVAFGQGLIAYFVVFVDYGFALSATRKISIERDDMKAVSRTASTVWAAKGLICVAALAVLLLLVTVVPKLNELTSLLLILYGTVVGNALFPVWIFQGMEKMVFISVINLAMSLLVVIGIFTMVRQPEHYLLYAALISLGAVGAGLTGMGVAFYKFRLQAVIPSMRDIWESLVEGWLLFLSTASVSLYTVGNAFILGLLTNSIVVGYYSAAEKIVKAVRGILSPVGQAAYPRFSKLALESRCRALEWGKRMLVAISALGGGLSIALLAGATTIVRILLGSEYEPSIVVMRVLAGLPLLIGMSNVLGVQIMLPFGKDRAFMTILLGAGLINIVFAVWLAPIWQAAGMAAAVLISETFVTVTMFIYLRHHSLSPLNKVSPEVTFPLVK